MLERETVELLIYIDAYERIRGRLDARVTPLVMHADARVTRAGDTLAPNEVQPDIAWANRDMYNLGPVRDFMVTCLKASRLRWVQSSAAGFEHPVFAKLVGNGVTLTNSNASAVPIAEFIFAQIIQSFHPQAERIAAQKEKRWQTYDFRDVHGTRWLVYGVGHIGSELAIRARAFGVEVVGCRRTPAGDEPVNKMIRPDELMDALPETDVVIMTAALNEENHHIVDERFINTMKRGATFVNIGRGGLVDEHALLQGLDAGKPALAILDVFEEEPLPGSSPFWSHPRVRLTAHCAGASPGTSLRGDEQFLANLRRYLDGEPLQMTVTL